MAQITIKVGLDDKGFNNGASAIEKRSAKLKASLVKLGQVGAIAFTAIATGVGLAVRSFAKFETGLIGVSKTTNISGKQLQRFGKEIQNLSKRIPVATDELLEISQTAGQLGVTGAKSILKFTQTIAKLGRTTDLQGEEAAATLTRILTITGEGVDEIDTFASVIVQLGNNFAATESQIAEATLRITAATSTFKLGSTNAAALATALTAVGQRSEVAGSVLGVAFIGIRKALDDGGDSLKNLTRLTGLTGDQLKQTFKKDATEVFRLLVNGLKTSTDGGASLANELKGVGLSGIRVNQVFGALAGGSGKLNDALKQASKESKNATALNKEFAAAMKSLENQFKLVSNRVIVLSQQFGKNASPGVLKLLRSFGKFIDLLEGAGTFKDTPILIDKISASIASLADTTLPNVLDAVTAFVGIFARKFSALKDVISGAVSLDPELLAKGLAEALKPIPKTFAQIAEEIRKVRLEEAARVNLEKLREVAKEPILTEEELDKKNRELAGDEEKLSEQGEIVREQITIEGEITRELLNEEAELDAQRLQKEISDKLQKDAAFQAANKANNIKLRNERIKAVTKAAVLNAAVDKKIEDDKAKSRRTADKKFLEDRKKFGLEFASLQKILNTREVQGVKQATGELAALQSSRNSTLKTIGKVGAVTSIIFNTATSASNVFAGFSTIPFIGPALGFAAAAAVIAFGAEQIGNVLSAQTGGIVPGVAGIPGGITDRDSVPAILSPGELVVPRNNFDEVINAVAAGRGTVTDAEGDDVGTGGAIEITFNTDEASQILTAQQIEDTALGISQQEAS